MPTDPAVELARMSPWSLDEWSASLVLLEARGFSAEEAVAIGERLAEQGIHPRTYLRVVERLGATIPPLDRVGVTFGGSGA